MWMRRSYYENQKTMVSGISSSRVYIIDVTSASVYGVGDDTDILSCIKRFVIFYRHFNSHRKNIILGNSCRIPKHFIKISRDDAAMYRSLISLVALFCFTCEDKALYGEQS